LASATTQYPKKEILKEKSPTTTVAQTHKENVLIS
jgi:hypothetical protein